MMANNIKIISESEYIESLLSEFKGVIGSDYDGYRNHLYRVLTYTLHFLRDSDHQSRAEIEIALVFHDIALWTDGELAYLEPSIVQMKKSISDDGLNLELIEKLIYWHHKVTPYKGKYADVVNAFRKADWVDASQGHVRKGLSKEQVRQTVEAIPVMGFYDTLTRLSADLNHGKTLSGVLKVVRNVYKI